MVEGQRAVVGTVALPSTLHRQTSIGCQSLTAVQ